MSEKEEQIENSTFHYEESIETWFLFTNHIGINEEGKEVKIKKRINSSWVISVYNLYNRANPYFIYLNTSGNLQDGSFQTKANQVSLFPILPSITWNFKF